MVFSFSLQNQQIKIIFHFLTIFLHFLFCDILLHYAYVS